MLNSVAGAVQVLATRSVETPRGNCTRHLAATLLRLGALHCWGPKSSMNQAAQPHLDRTTVCSARRDGAFSMLAGCE
jgi:hypothetical protein